MFDNLFERIDEARETYVFEVDTEKLNDHLGATRSGKILGGKYAVIEGKNGWILTINEGVHWKKKLGEPVKLPLYAKDKEAELTDDDRAKGITKKHTISIFPEDEVELTLEDFEKFEKPATSIDQASAIDWKKWIHYFGIKDRIYHNYQLLLKSIQEIGAEVNMPEWEWVKW